MHALLKYIKQGKRFDNTGDFVKYLSKHSKVFGFVFDSAWYDIGSKEALEKARKEFNSGALQAGKARREFNE